MNSAEEAKLFECCEHGIRASLINIETNRSIAVVACGRAPGAVPFVLPLARGMIGSLTGFQGAGSQIASGIGSWSLEMA